VSDDIPRARFKPTPEELASYDQAWAASQEILWYLVASFRQVRAEDRADGLPESVSIVALAHHLAEKWDNDALCSALAAAVVHLDCLDVLPATCPHDR
jgi:hypothetical protein